MRLVKFTSTGKAGDPVYINPAQVISVEQFNKYSLIVTTGQNSDGGGRKYAVVEDAEQIAAAFQE